MIDPLFKDLFLLLLAVWLVAITLRRWGLPTVMGELIAGVVLGPAVLGWVHPSEITEALAEIGIFFLMFHAGIETQPREFFEALKKSMGVAIVGAIVPFGVSYGVALAFGLGQVAAIFVGLTMTATAVVVTLKILQDLNLQNTRMARIIVASCVIDDLLTLILFGVVIGLISGNGAVKDQVDVLGIVITVGKVVAFFGVSILIGYFVYPHLTIPFRSENGKGFTFVLVMGFAAAIAAEAMGLHAIMGGYLAGLFFESKVAHPNLVRIVKDRMYGLAYSFLGPLFFITLGFHITFDIGSGVGMLIALTLAVIVGQILSAGGMARRLDFTWPEALTVGVGMCGRAEMAFILAALALSKGAVDAEVFSILIFTAFLLNLFTPLALKACAVLLAGEAQPADDSATGMVEHLPKMGEELAPANPTE